MVDTRDEDHAPVGSDDDDGHADITVTDEGRRPVTRVLALPPASSTTNTTPSPPPSSPRSAPRTSPRSSSGLGRSGEGLGSDAFVDRFQRREVLGRGGMGEVTSWADDRLGRDVAVKRLLPHAVDDVGARARFLREARVQGQLEHPGIVPVYDLRDDVDGGLTLTMKRVRGKTLAQLLDEHRRSGDDVVPRRLLSSLANVCLAVEFAHAHGIVHRDLKPGNVMLGDYGEVYVLDWGLAKILADHQTEILGSVLGDDLSGDALLDASPETKTQSGSVLGTLGYMAPEQLDESVAPITPATDVYALGAILFEVLTGAPLLAAPSTVELMQRTLSGVDARARQRTPQRAIPPELEDLCVQATQKAPSARTSSARALGEAIERYLEGDRDLDRRRTLANAHIVAATTAMQVASSTSTAEAEEHARATAMRELGQALVLEPGNARAGHAVLELLATPPTHTPADVVKELDDIDQQQINEGARAGPAMIAVWLLFLGFGFFMPVQDWRPVAAMGITATVCFVATVANARAQRVPPWRQVLVFVLFSLLCLMSGFTLGPLVAVPTLIATFVAALQTHPSLRMRQLVLGIGVGMFVVMAGLEWAGVLPRQYDFVDGELHVLPVTVAFTETPTRLLLLLSAVGAIVATALFVSNVRGAQARAQRQVSLLGWHLRQLLPRGTTNDDENVRP